MTTTSAARAAPKLSLPLTAAEPPAACMSLAAASALSFDRDPSTIRYPASAQRLASAEPRSPVPPRTAMVGCVGNSLASSLRRTATKVHWHCLSSLYGTMFRNTISLRSDLDPEWRRLGQRGHRRSSTIEEIDRA